MMKTDVVVEGLNRALEDLRKYRGVPGEGHFIYVRERNIPSTFTKAVKEYIAKLYFVVGKAKYLIISKSYIGKSITDEHEEECKREVDIMMMQDLFFLMSQRVIMDIMIDGKYEELKEIWQQVQKLMLTRLSSQKSF